MADTNKKEYTSNLHPKGDMDTTVYPNVKSENIIDKDTTAYNAGKVPDSSLVSRSLDGLNENLETTKIQVATNKKNIETLQGNYTGLQYQVNTNSSDIALTKTQVETNKTNIAKNTQDIATNTQNIENLSAVMPTDINVDANGYAILEHDCAEITGQTKKVKFAQSDKPASFSEVTIPTASALKTKDGTSFGGGDTSSIPTDINVDNDYHLILEHDGTEITGQKKLLKLPKYNTDLNTFDFNGNYVVRVPMSLNTIKNILFGYDLRNSITSSGGFFNSILVNDVEYRYSTFIQECISGDAYTCGFGFTIKKSNFSNRYYFYHSGSTTDKRIRRYTVYFPDDKGGTIALTSDLDAKQDKRFVHTVEIHYASNGSYFCFTGTSDKNTPIDSVEKLTTVFANRDFGGVGIFGSAGLSKIHVGTSVNDTTFKKYMNNGEYTNPSEETFAVVFNTTGFTITDSVTPM